MEQGRQHQQRHQSYFDDTSAPTTYASQLVEPSPALSTSLGGHSEPLLSRPDIVEKFIELLCIYEPKSVLPFLSTGSLSAKTAGPSAAAAAVLVTGSGPTSAAGEAPPTGEVPPRGTAGAPEGYDVRRCISRCRAAGVVDAEAFLHERLGDLDEAGRLYLAEVQR